jgi:hypothetical protein
MRVALRVLYFFVAFMVFTIFGHILHWSFFLGLPFEAIIYWLLCFTTVKEGTAKIIVRVHAYKKTLLQKQGHIIDDHGNVISGENPNFHIGGFHWVGWLKPIGLDKVYTTTMKYVKALSDGTFEKRSDIGTDFILCMDYQYGLEFSSAEDKDRLPLSGKITMTARISNPYLAMFHVKDWYDALVGRVLPRVREYISEHSYEDLINDEKTQLDAEVFKTLKQGGQKSIISILRDQYGITLVALETINIDPPPEYRAATTAEYLAKQRVKVAAQEKTVEAEATSGALELMIDGQIKTMQNKDGANLTLTKEDILRIREECLNLLLRERALKSGALREVRFGNADGTSFGSGSISEIVGGVVAAALLAKTGFDSGSGGAKKEGEKNRKNQKDEEDLKFLDTILGEEDKKTD